MQDQDVIDALGLLCPLPVLKLRKRIKTLKNGDIISLKADDPAAVVDVPHFCAEAGHKLVEMVDEAEFTLFRVQKAGN
ncbi:MAG: sulfurtransferase TusA family protein [Pseudomonadota bacterium]